MKQIEQTVFFIKEMDCPSEEQMIRMKLADNEAVRQLSFDFGKRQLTAVHTEGTAADIAAAINTLDLGVQQLETVEYSGDEAMASADSKHDKKLLWKVLLINLSVFVIEFAAGLIGNSMGLVADSLDELADAFVYAFGIYAISGTAAVKKRIARTSGLLQLLLALWGFAEVVRRFVGDEPMPDFIMMIAFSLIALAGNAASLTLLGKTKSKGVHIKATQIFTANDVIVNIGVIAAAVLVAVLHSEIPDLVIGAIVFAIVLRGAIRIFKLAK